MWMVAVGFFVEHGILPNDGGLFDQDLRFFIAIQQVAPEIAKKFKGAASMGGPGGLSGKLRKMGRSMNLR